MTKNPYPYPSFKFRIEIGGITVAQVSEVTGLQIETETETYEEGGVNDFVHKLPKRTKYQNITLKRGITDLDDMWKWYDNVVSGKIERKNGAIVLMDVTGKDKWRWNFSKAYPVKWIGPDFKADSNTVAFETIELAHNGIIKKG
ncbi:phage tail protein [Methanolobus sp. ZRKC3]|uniref:phage tail protein n=1 Tax=Methanolobus sp. ZRKC3 TaxID=3125786 RepID=UPI0032520161